MSTVDAMTGRADSVDRTTLVRGAVVTVLVVVIGLAFVGSYVGALHEPRFHGVDVAVAGPGALAGQLERGDALDVTAVGSRAEAIALIDDRKAFGAVVADGRRTEVLIASAAGTAVAQGLRESLPAAAGGAGRDAPRVVVTDVKPLPRADSRGVSPFYLVVGIVVAGYIGAAFFGLVFGTKPSGRRAWWRLLRVGTVALLVGPSTVALVQAIGPLSGHYLALAAAGTALCFTVGSVAVGVQSALGVVGTGVSILLFVVLGNPSSGGSYAPSCCPGSGAHSARSCPPAPGSTWSATSPTSTGSRAAARCS